MSHDVIVVKSTLLCNIPFLYLGYAFDDAIKEYVRCLPRTSIPNTESAEYIIFRNEQQVNGDTGLATYVLQEKHSKVFYEVKCEYFDENGFLDGEGYDH